MRRHRCHPDFRSYLIIIIGRCVGTPHNVLRPDCPDHDVFLRHLVDLLRCLFADPYELKTIADDLLGFRKVDDNLDPAKLGIYRFPPAFAACVDSLRYANDLRWSVRAFRHRVQLGLIE